MDHQRAAKLIRSREILAAALDYAIFDRLNSDYFYDPTEIGYASTHKDELLEELIDELKDLDLYRPRIAFAYYPPKNDLCDRRMIYIPIKDLTVRYAVAIIFSNEIESDLSSTCFANRRAQGEEKRVRFTESFATGGWSSFCKWQKQQCSKYIVLLKSDLSAFYDSISHDYLIRSIEKHLQIPQDTPIIRLVKRLLEINVIHYSTNLEEISNPIRMKQGLPIGDGVEGFLANIYLKEVDDAMKKRKVSYGRYVDDIRIFGNSRDEVLKELRVLQEFFLNLGLNLNSSKTKIAEDSKFDWILSNNYDISSGPEPDEVPEAGVQIDSEIDVSFDEFDKTFNEDDDFDPAKNGRDFCKFLSAHKDDKTPIVSLEQREGWHIEYLYRVVVIGRGSIKHAVWLLVQSSIYSGLKESVQRLARQKILDILVTPSVCSYAKYRTIHHLTKKRKNGNRFINQLSEEIQKEIAEQIPNYISSQAFELNLIALHLLRVEGRSVEEIRQVVAKFANNACEPLKRSLEYIDDRLDTTGTAEEDVSEDSESLEEY